MSGPRGAEERLRRLLVMLPWLMEEGQVPLATIASRFDLTEAQVTRELELVAMCGLPPYVDEMIDVFIDDGIVYVGVPRLFTRPLRLTAPEGFSLLAAARAALDLPGADADGPLARGLDKLSRVLGVDDDDTLGLVVDLSRPALTDLFFDAVADGAELLVTYYSAGRDDLSDRVIVPRHVFTDGEHWYVVADDDRSGERRTFRIDRMERATATGRLDPIDIAVEAPTDFFGDPDIPRVEIRLAPEGQWILDRYPVDRVEELVDPPGWITVTLPVSSDRWLDRLLLRLGPTAQVEGDRVGQKQLAERILANYASTG